MAKAGFWLRGSRGKLAGAVTQKGQNGTIIRENVTPKNPRTDKQYYQRAIMATVMQAMKAGKKIFDHSFEGKEQGQKSLQYFVSRNARILRANMAAEIAAGTTAENSRAYVVAPKAISPVPNKYLISEGTYDQSFFSPSARILQYTTPSISYASGDNVGTIATKLKAVGLIPGDLYTFVFFSINGNYEEPGDDDYIAPLFKVENSENYAGCFFPTRFYYIQLRVKDALSSTEEDPGSWEPYFELVSTNVPDLNLTWESVSSPDQKRFYADQLISTDAWVGGDGAFGLIRSRDDEDLRSTTYMDVYVENLNFGISTPYALAAWKQGTENLGSSELILEGGDS